MTTLTKQLDVGKWRLGVAGEVTGVRIVGMRNRTHPLIKISNAEMQTRLMKRPNGEVTDPAVLRGVPSAFAQEGKFLMLWPSPAHTWSIQIDTQPFKEKAIA